MRGSSVLKRVRVERLGLFLPGCVAVVVGLQLRGLNVVGGLGLDNFELPGLPVTASLCSV